MKKPFLTVIATVVIILFALGWRYGYRVGIVPSDTVIDLMSDEEKLRSMQKVPMESIVVERLDTKEKATENTLAQASLSVGVAERMANFEGASFQSAQGMVRIVSIDGRLQLVFDESFDITQGPGLYVYISSKVVGSFKDLREGGVEIARLKSAKGTQVYDLPADIKLEDIRSIAIGCKPYRIVFGKAIIGGLE